MTETPERALAAAKAKAPVAPAAAKTDDAAALRKERDELKQRLERAHEDRARELRSADPGSEHFDAELAIQRLWPGSVRDAT